MSKHETREHVGRDSMQATQVRFETPTYQTSGPEDEILLERFSDGDTAGFDLLVRRHIDFAYATAKAYTTDNEAAKDIVAIALAKAFRAAPRFRGQCRFSTWLYRIVVNCAKDYVHRKQHRPIASIEDLLDMDPAIEHRLTAIPSRPMQVLEISPEFRDELQQAICDLPPAERDLLLLFHRDEASYKRIGSILHIPIGTVRSRLHRVREHLRTRLSRFRSLDAC